MKVLLHYNAGDAVRGLLAAESRDGLDVTWSPEGDRSALLAAMADTEVLLHVLEPVTADVIAAAPRLRLVQKLGVGVNTIDLDAAHRCGVAVANLPGSNAVAVAEHALALLLAVLRRIPAFDADVRCGRGWPLAADVPERLGEVNGRVVGLVGYGTIARRFETALRALGADVLHSTRSGGSGAVPLDDLLGRVDVLSLHLPLTAETQNLIDADRLGRLRPGAVVVNTSRGGIVDETALAAMLGSGLLAGAGIDVFADEPLDPARSPLVALPNVVLTPHVAWLTRDTMLRAIRLGIENARRVHGGAEPEHRVV
jgi:phosphoglycerate dehydrogenase-like enzyme